jgi:CheY-like chemotaxis protein
VAQACRAPKRTILCIDDDAAVLKYEKALLERSGYKVLSTLSPQQGVTLAMRPQVDAVVLDYQMPGMNGDKVAAAIKRSRPEVVIVIFSASEIPEEAVKLADAVVPKLDAAGQLLPVVAHLCNRFSPS